MIRPEHLLTTPEREHLYLTSPEFHAGIAYAAQFLELAINGLEEQAREFGQRRAEAKDYVALGLDIPPDLLPKDPRS